MATEYDKKIAELKVYLPALERRISDARNRKDSAITGRLEKLRNIVIKKIKVPMEILYKTEEAIRKFIKDVSSNTTTPADIPEKQSPGSKSGFSPKNELKPTEIKIEAELHPPAATTDDDDDVKFVESSTSESIIILDDDSSDEEPTRHVNNETKITDPLLTTIKTELEHSHETPSTLSKEIHKVEDSDKASEQFSLNEKSISLAISSNCESTIDCNVFSQYSLNKQCDTNHTSDNNSTQETIAQVQFDANKVDESRGILQEIESQLKELKTTSQLPLSLDDIDKNDSINEFLSKSNDMSCNKSFNLLENEVSPQTAAKQIQENCEKGDNFIQKLPFPFPSFSNPILNDEAYSPNEEAEKDVASKKANEVRKETVEQDSTTEISNSSRSLNSEGNTNSESSLPPVINQNKVDDVEAASLPLPVDTSASPASESMAQVISAIDSNSTPRTSNRLSDIIASLRRNLNHIDSTAPDNLTSKEKAKAKEKVEESKPSGMAVKEIQATELPIAVPDTLVSEVTSDEEAGGVVIEDSSFAMSSSLIGNLGVCAISSLDNVSDLPNNIMDGDDSLDREINQALSGTSANQLANNIEHDSIDIPQGIDLNVAEMNTLKHNEALKETEDEHVDTSNDKNSDEPLQIDLDSSLSYVATSCLIENNESSLIMSSTVVEEETCETVTTNTQDLSCAEEITDIVGEIKASNHHETEDVAIEDDCSSSSQIEKSNIDPIQTESDSKYSYEKVGCELNIEAEESQGTVIFEIMAHGYDNDQQVFKAPNSQESQSVMIEDPIELSSKNENAPDSSAISTVDKITTSPCDGQQSSLVLNNSEHMSETVHSESIANSQESQSVMIEDPIELSSKNEKAPDSSAISTVDKITTSPCDGQQSSLVLNNSEHMSENVHSESIADEPNVEVTKPHDSGENIKMPVNSPSPKAETIENVTNMDELQTEQSTDDSDKCEKVTENMTKTQIDAMAANEAKEASEELFLAKLRSTVSIRPITPIHDQEQSSEKSNQRKHKELESKTRGPKVIASFGKPKPSAGCLNTFKSMQKEYSKPEPIDKTESHKKETPSNSDKIDISAKFSMSNEKNEVKEQIVPSTNESEETNSTVADGSVRLNGLISNPSKSPHTFLATTTTSISNECKAGSKEIFENSNTESIPSRDPKKEKMAERVVAAFNVNPEFQDLVKRKRDLERKLEELKKQLEQPQINKEAPTTSTNAPLEKSLTADQNLSEISGSDKDCESLSLSEISDPEPGEIVNERPKPQEMPLTIKREYLPPDSGVPYHMQFISEPSRLGNEPLQITIKNEYNMEEDLRLKLMAKANNESYLQYNIQDARHKKRKKKHKKKKRRVHQEEVPECDSPIRYVDCQGNVKYCRDDLNSGSSDGDELNDLILRRRILNQRLLISDSYAQLELDGVQREYDGLLKSYKRKTEKLVKSEYDRDDNKYECYRDLDRRYGCTFKGSGRILPHRESESPPVSFLMKNHDSLSPLGRRSLSPGRFSQSPIRLSRSPMRVKRSPRRHSISPPRRRSISPKRFSKSPLGLSRSPLRRRSISPRRLSRSPLRMTRSPKRRSRSPRKRPFGVLRRLSRSPRRKSRSPRRKSRSPRRISRSPRRISRSPRRNSWSPRRNSRSPRRMRRSPIRSVRSPRRSRSPKRLARSPRRSSRSPRRTLRSPRRFSRSPRRRVSRSPRRTTRPLRRLSRSPRRLSPKTEHRSPGHTSKSPRLSKSPKKSIQSTSQPLNSLKKENQVTSYEPTNMSPNEITSYQPLNSPKKENHVTSCEPPNMSPKKSNQSTSQPLNLLKEEIQVTSGDQPPNMSTQSEIEPSNLLKTENQENHVKTSVEPTVSKIPAESEKSINQGHTETNCMTVIALTDSEDETPTNDTSGEVENDPPCFTIEVSDEEEFVEPPPPPIISSNVKKPPKNDVEELTSAQKQNTGNKTELPNVILIDDDEEEELKATNDCQLNKNSSDMIPVHPKTEINSKSDGSDDGHSMGANLDDEDLYAPEDDPTVESVEMLKEKNLMELQAIKIKLEREMGLSEDILSQLIGSAVDKFNGQSSETQHYDSIGENNQYPAMVKLPYQFYDLGSNYPRVHVSHKDPRLNRLQPTHTEPSAVVVKPQLEEAPPPPMIPRLTPAVALPPGSPTSKSSGYKDGYSDDDCLSTGSGSISDGSYQSDSSKNKKQFVMVEISKLEEIIGQQIAKFLAANKEEVESKKKSPPKKTKKDVNAPTTEVATATDATEITLPKKARKNALSKDGSGPRHMTAEKIVSDIRKSMVATLSKSNISAPDKVERPKSRTRIVKRFETSSESETEKEISPPTKKLSKNKKTTEEPESLRNRITHDLTGIIKLGQTPKSTKGKPAPALKLAEQITDVNLLTPLREIPYDDKRKKKPEAGQSKKRVLKNVDITMHCNSDERNCLLCKEMGKDEDLISHYVNVHRENEVYIARLEPHQVAALKQRPNRVKPSRKSNIEKFTGKCPFCNEEMICPIGRFMEHFASHTGEYAYECDCCGTRDSRKRDLLQHCNTECDKGAKFIYVYRYDLSNKTILGYICAECNYTQLNSANVIKHIRTEHEHQHVKSADLLTVTLFDVSYGDSTDSGVEDEAVDNIEVNNEAIAEEEDDYDAYDNFDYMPNPPPPPRAPCIPTSGGDEFECVKNEMLTDVIDAIENIDWKPLEETLNDRDDLELTKNTEGTTLQEPRIPMNDSIHIVPKGELNQSVCERSDIGTQIFTEVHAMASQSLTSVTTKEEPLNNESTAIQAPVRKLDSEEQNSTSLVAKTQPDKDGCLRALLEGTARPETVAVSAVSRLESVTSKVVKLREDSDNIPNLSRVQSIGIEKISPTRVKLHCFVQNCDFNPTDSLEDLRKHMKAHRHKWSGKCMACGKGSVKKPLSIDRELLHLVNEHLPKKTMAPKLLRPWIANDKSECYKTKEVCDMLTNQFHLENLYKCMGPDCVFTTNSSTDMQFHITLAHNDDHSALSCCYCNDRFIHANGLVDHIGKVHGASIYQCSKCFYRSVAAYNVQMHQRTFHAENKILRILQCPGQSHNFSTEILEILDNRQRNVKPLSCPSCHKMVFVKHLLLDHIAKEHPKMELGDINSALYDCIYCNFGTTDLLSIRQHMANEHPSQLLYVCGLVFIKAQHPLANQTVDCSSIKTTSLVYIGDTVGESIFISKDRTNSILSKNSIEWVNYGKDATELNEKIRQTFGECVINFNHVETYIRKIDEGMKPDTVRTEEVSELEQLVSKAIGDTGYAGKALYRCGYSKCESAYDTFEQFDRHINSHNNNKLVYRCPHCNRVIAANQIRMHILQHRRHRYLCFFCGESSAAQNTAIEHLKLAHQSSSVVFVYLTSDRRDWGTQGQINAQESRIFAAKPRNNNEDAAEHMLEVLRKRCGQHDSNMIEPAAVERPESPIERKEETLVPVFVAPSSRLCCNIDLCPFVAKADEELLQHISDRHLIITSGMYSCAHCSYTLGSAQMKISRIGNHLQYHGPTIVVCNVCNYYHHNRYRVLNHINTCHPYNFVTLTLHTRTPQGSKTKIEILYNKSVRSPEDSYKCTLCEAILTEYEDLFVHMKELHQLNVLFKCDACAFFDNTLEVVEAHTEKVHGNDEDKRRIRSVFVPIGNKWVQNLSPFELLFEYSKSNEGKSLENYMTPSLPVVSVAEKGMSLKSETITAPEGKKRKLEETESPKPESKKSRTSGLKRRKSPSSTEESVKKQKISSSPERAAVNENEERSLRDERTQSDSACAKLSNSDSNVLTKQEVDTSKSTNNAAEQLKLTESSINPPAVTNLPSKPADKPKSNENVTMPEQKSLPRLKVKPMSKLMPQNVAEPLSEASPKRAELSAIFSPPTESPVPSATNAMPTRRRATEVYLICFQCGLKGDCFIKLDNHCRTQHPGDAIHFRVAKKLLCAFCYTIASFTEMKAHHFSVHANDAFITRETSNHKKCAECAFEYSKIKELKDHCDIVHAGLHLQMHSSYEFLNQEYLEELLKIGGDVIAEVCRCPDCDHIYLQESHCKTHMKRAHASLAPDALPNRVPFKRLLYGCNQCNVFFETETRAIQHIRKHIDPYGCNYCEISFPTHSALEDHYRLCHKSSEKSYKFKNVSENFKRFMEMLLRFSNGLVLSKYEAEYTDYGRHDEFLQRIENMEKFELRHWISKQTRTQAIDSIARIKIEIEREADMFLPVNNQ